MRQLALSGVELGLFVCQGVQQLLGPDLGLGQLVSGLTQVVLGAAQLRHQGGHLNQMATVKIRVKAFWYHMFLLEGCSLEVKWTRIYFPFVCLCLLTQ